jgi:hypothetical protein
VLYSATLFLQLGKLLYEIIVYDLKIDTHMFKTASTKRNMVPAFYTIYRNYSYQVFEEIKVTSNFILLYFSTFDWLID